MYRSRGTAAEREGVGQGADTSWAKERRHPAEDTFPLCIAVSSPCLLAEAGDEWRGDVMRTTRCCAGMLAPSRWIPSVSKLPGFLLSPGGGKSHEPSRCACKASIPGALQGRIGLAGSNSTPGRCGGVGSARLGKPSSALFRQRIWGFLGDLGERTSGSVLQLGRQSRPAAKEPTPNSPTRPPSRSPSLQRRDHATAEPTGLH